MGLFRILSRRKFFRGVTTSAAAIGAGTIADAATSRAESDHASSIRMAQSNQQSPGPLSRLPSRSSATTVHVNDFGAIADGHSHPLSSKYTTLAEAQSVYPFAQALTDEIDWCAWMAAALAIYNATNQVIPGSGNWASGTIKASGHYVVNRTIVLNCAGLRIAGDGVSPAAVGKGTSISYNGPPGSLEAPVYILDYYTIDEQKKSGTQPGAIVRSGATSGGRVRVERITFLGQNGDMRANSSSVSKFVSGIRIRMAFYARIEDCNFGGTLWDGIVCTGPQQFFKPVGCRFDQVHRDAVAVRSIRNNFSAAVWIEENEFYFVGRYQLLINCLGSVEAAPRVINNDFEGAYPESFFVRNPEWWIHGVVAPMCVVGGGNLNWHDNRTENISLTKGVLGELHLVGCQNPSIKDNTLHKIICTATTRSQVKTDALIAFENANNYGDITDQLNYNCGSANDFLGPNDSMSLANNYNLLSIAVVDRVGITNAGFMSVDMVGFEFLSYPIKKGAYATQIDASVQPTKMPSNTYNMCGTSVVAPSYTSQHPGVLRQHLYSGMWGSILAARRGYDNQPEIELFGEVFLREGNNDGVTPPAAYNGYVGLIMNRLVANMTAPENFLGAPLFYANPKDAEGKSVGYYECAEVRDHPVRHMAGPPTSGTWPRRSLVWNTNPAPGAPVGWVCTAGGSPGTWNAFGLIS